MISAVRMPLWAIYSTVAWLTNPDPLSERRNFDKAIYLRADLLVRDLLIEIHAHQA